MAIAGRRNPRLFAFLYPLVILGSAAAVVFLGLYAIDYRNAVTDKGFFSLLIAFDPETLQNALGNMAQTVAAVLGIVITVVSIVVQLAATRYAPRIAEMFFRDRTNIAVLSFFVVACINVGWVSVSVMGTNGAVPSFVPQVSVVVSMFLVTFSLLLMVPYFAYVFDFLDPDRVVGRIQQQAVDSAAGTAAARGAAGVGDRQRNALTGIEQLSDIAVNAVSQKDKAIASGAIDAVKDLVVTYLGKKPAIAKEWFVIGGWLRQNPDFVSLAGESIDDLAEQRVWLEWKALRQYQAIYNESLGEMQDINHLIAINTRYIGEAALKAKDEHAIALSVKFFNTYMRATINKQQVRTAYNVLNQYRQLAESAIAAGETQRVREIGFYFKYYGQIAHGLDLGFVTETVAYDMATLCEHSFTARSPAHDEVLKLLLELDKEPENENASQSQEHMLRGVRKAQAKLASFYLAAGPTGEPFARLIFSDMKDERSERLSSIRDELLNIKSKDFWEVIDRGTNFDYVDNARKAQLVVFFSWFPALSERRVSDATTT